MTWAYYLTNGIYPDWALFTKTIDDPLNIKQQLFWSRKKPDA